MTASPKDSTFSFIQRTTCDRLTMTLPWFLSGGGMNGSLLAEDSESVNTSSPVTSASTGHP